MDKYLNNNTSDNNTTSSRTRKNQDLYQKMNNRDLENVNLTSNAHIIGDNSKNIDVGKVKEMIEKTYQKTPPKRKSLYNENSSRYKENKEEETKEYDINAILEKAKQDKDIDYERDRLKKIRDTQYNILKGLNLEEEENRRCQEDKLINLINTITEKEDTREVNPLDILSDLKGSEQTEVIRGLKEEIEKEDILDNVKKEVKKEVDKTFYTNSLSFTKSDFDDFNDLKNDLESNKLLVKILLVVVVMTILIGIFLLLNNIFRLNWF